MFEIEYPPPLERVVLAALFLPGTDKNLFDEDLQEMTQLCRTAGASVEQILVQKRDRPVAGTFMGGGKLEEIGLILKEKKCRTLVIDAQLSPGQVRTIEKIIEGKVIDRSQLILDIFAQHARTNEARLQVELAQLRTLYPRLTHAWTHFSQQVGGIGTRGPGEKQLEVDRRLVQRRIHDLGNKLKAVERSRVTQRKSRESMFRVALVGYTNVGKSSILNGLCGSDVLVQNKLFATLDTATRRAYIPDAGTVAISDTVGFIRKLPHQLVASFMSTLEVVSEAHLLLVILDASSSWTGQQLATTREVLKELNADSVKCQLVFNKADLCTDPFERKRLELAHPDAVFVSAFSAADMAMLKQQIADYIREYERKQAEERLIAESARLAEEARLQT
jgi:GTPase